MICVGVNCMKIQSINSFIPMSNQRREQRFDNINFLGKLTINQIRKYPLDKKLPYMFEHCENGDVITVGKNLEEVQKGLMNVVDNFAEVIKRVFFIKHGGLSVPIAFGKSFADSWACINIGDKKVLLSMNDKVEDIEPKDSVEIAQGDIIINNNVNIPIGMFGEYPKVENSEDGTATNDDIDDFILLSDPENFATETYIFDEVQLPKVYKANIEAFELLKTGGLVKTHEVKKTNESKKLSFKDIGGLDHVIERLEDAILFPIRYADAHREEGVDVSKGVLLYGKPGTGKTLLAEALANEADAHFRKICSTDLEAKYVGETEGKWRNLFKEAVENQPSIIFIDEIDAVTKERGASANAHISDKIVNQILSLMSDLEKSDDNVFVIATTNKPETMDSAIIRSGRFGEIIEVTEPDREGKRAIFNIHTSKKRIDPELDVEALLNEFDKRGFTGADIKHITNKAHSLSWKRQGIRQKMKDRTLTKQDLVGINTNMEDFKKAIDEWDSAQGARQKRKPIGFIHKTIN